MKSPGLYYYNSTTINSIKIGKNGELLGHDGGSNKLIWTPDVKVIEGQAFHDFLDQETTISRDSSFTIAMMVNGENAKLLFTGKATASATEDAVVTIPANTAIVLLATVGETQTYYYCVTTSATSSLPLSSFSKMGGGAGALPTSFAGQFAFDFSQTDSGMRGAVLNIGVAYGTDTAASSTGTVNLVDAAAFTVSDEATADTDLVETVTVTTNSAVLSSSNLDLTTGSWFRVSTGRATIWDKRDMALVIENAGSTALPPDAVLKVRVDSGAETTATKVAGGKFIVPLGALGTVKNVQITLSSAMFPQAATTYTLSAKLTVAKFPADGSPLNGTVASTATLTFASGVGPAVKITGNQVGRPGQQMSFTVANQNIPASATVTATVYKKTGADWSTANVTEKQTTELKAAGAAASSPWSVSFTTDAGDFDSYKLVVRVTDGSTTLLEVPYYFLAVKNG